VTDLVPSLTMLGKRRSLRGALPAVLNDAHGVWGDRDGNIFLAEPNPSRLTRLTPV
jgi:hypothetical protein